MKFKTHALILIASRISLAGPVPAEWGIEFDAQTSPPGLCRKLDRLFVWGDNLQLMNTLDPAQNTSNILRVGLEPVNEYHGPRRDLAGTIRYGGQRGDRVWIVPSRSNSHYVEAVMLDPRVGPFQNYCVYHPLQPMPIELFQ